jgi:hypothetical protein
VPFEGVGPTRGMRAFTSDDGGQTWGASVVISLIAARRVGGGSVRTSPLPTAPLSCPGVRQLMSGGRYSPKTRRRRSQHSPIVAYTASASLSG